MIKVTHFHISKVFHVLAVYCIIIPVGQCAPMHSLIMTQQRLHKVTVQIQIIQCMTIKRWHRGLVEIYIMKQYSFVVIYLPSVRLVLCLCEIAKGLNSMKTIWIRNVLLPLMTLNYRISPCRGRAQIKARSELTCCIFRVLDGKRIWK